VDLARQRLALGRGQGVRAARRRDRRAEQRLARVDVADAGNALLVQERRLDRPAAARVERAQALAVDALGHRVDALAGRPKRQLLVRARSDPGEQPESPRVHVRQRRAVLKSQQHVRVSGERAGRARVGRVETKLPRHAQVRDEPRPASEVDEQELAVAAHARHREPRKLLAEPARDRPA
jgi:hypothetical protein